MLAEEYQSVEETVNDLSIDPDGEGFAIPEPGSSAIFIFRQTKDGRWRLLSIWPESGRMRAIDLGIIKTPTIECAQVVDDAFAEEGDFSEIRDLSDDEFQEMSLLPVKKI